MTTAVTKDLHLFVLSLPRFRWDCPKRDLPMDGIYFFFEQGEIGSLGAATGDRIVRVGTHRGDGNFPGRIRQHYGHMKSLGGNKNGSVFRRHVGGALLRRLDEADPRLATWVPQGGASDPEVEASVSEWMRQHLSFACVRVDTKEARMRFERRLIALLAQHPLTAPSDGWLGRWAESPIIRRYGIWNTQEVSASPLTTAELIEFRELAQS